jgi:hypothetical protein
MKIKRVTIGGNREEINRITKEHTPNLIDSVKRSDLIFTPELLIKKLFKGSSQEYDTWLMKNKLHPSQINYHDIKQKQELLKRLRVYTMRLLDEAKTDSMFSNELGNIMVTKWLDSFDTLENHVFDLSDFDKVEFIKISDAFKKKFTTHSPFAFLTIDDVNQQLKVIESHKVLLLLNQKLPMGNKRGTPVGQEPEKLYQSFFTSIGYKGKGELTEGLNHHRTNFKNFNFNLNTEIRVLNDIIYELLKYDRKQIQVAFLFGAYGKKLYFESDIKGTERKQEEIEALAIAEGATMIIQKELHKERQGSIAVDKTSAEVKKRIEHPKVFNEQSITPKVTELKPLFEPEKQDTLRIEKIRERDEITREDTVPNKSISHTLKAFEKEMLIKQKGYAELAKEKINEALANRVQYIKEFHTFLNKGMGVSDALNKFSERYANNPYIKGIIETSIAGELQLQSLKDKGIEELTHNINTLNSDIQGLKQELDVRETEIASLNQKMESLVVGHTKQLEGIEVNLSKLIEERVGLIESRHKQSEMIGELRKLIEQYEKSLRAKDEEIQEVRTLENEKKFLFRQIENYDSEIKHYTRQIEQLKEENRLTLSTTDLLKMSNKMLESKNREQEKINRLLHREKNLLQEELVRLQESKG